MVITRTPLRLSLLGGNTDFREYYLNYGGLVLTTTIDKYIYCIVKERFDNLIVVSYSIKETVTKIDDLKHELVREALKLVNITKGIEICFLSDIPTQGTGLGSSSAVTVGVLNALHTYLGENIGAKQIAEEAIKIELDILGKPIGVQDQYVIALGGLNAIKFDPSGVVSATKILISDSLREDFNNSLMLFYTGITRKTDNILASINITNHKLQLDQNKTLAENGINALLDGNLREFGKILDAYWKIKKQFSNKITNPTIDSIYELAKEAGTLGGKIIGAGGGGFLLVMFPANKRAKIREALSNYAELPFRFEKGGSKVLLNI